MLRFSHEEPTGVWVCGPDGDRVCLAFARFVDAIEDGVLRPDDWVWSRIVTRGRWVRAADMRLYRVLTSGDTGVRPPPPISP